MPSQHLNVKACRVCTTVPADELAELNLLLADPSQWPAALLADWAVPPGVPLPGRIRSWGGEAVMKDWLDRHGFPGISMSARRFHWTRHVPHLATTAKELVEVGKLGIDSRAYLVSPSRPRLFVDYYAAGLQLGVYALEHLRKQIEAAEAAHQAIPEKTLWQLAELGAKLAVSQASLWARGSKPEADGDELDGFRRGAAPLPSKRFGNSRVRVVDGNTRPVTDRGRADRRKYNTRAAEEGSSKLPD